MAASDNSAKRTTNNSPLLNEKEAATYLGMSLQWMQISRYKGEGPPFLKIGRAVRYDLEDLNAWLKTRRYHSTSEFLRPQG